MSKRILLLAGSLMLCFTLSACGQATVETTPPPPTPTPEVVTTPAPTPKAPDFEEPPVDIVFSGKNDLDGDGIISKSEWDTWVTAHPEDTNQDMVITDAEGTPPVTAPAETPKPVTPPAKTPKPVTQPAETAKPVEPPENTGHELTEEERQAIYENTKEWADKIGGTADPDFPGLIGAPPGSMQ